MEISDIINLYQIQLENVNQLWTFYSFVVGGGALYLFESDNHKKTVALGMASICFFAGNYITLHGAYVSLIKIWESLKYKETSDVVISLKPISLLEMQVFYFGVIVAVFSVSLFLSRRSNHTPETDKR